MLLGNDKKDQSLLIGRGYDGNKKGTPRPKAECKTDREACDWYASLWRQVRDVIRDYERDRKEVGDDAE
jgi:hypothetical protein